MIDKKLPQTTQNSSIAKILERSRKQLSVTQNLLHKVKAAKERSQQDSELPKNKKAIKIKILINAVNDKSKSKPFIIYQIKESELPKQFVLRLDSAVNKNGEAQLRISNYNMGLIASHQPKYLEGILAGYKKNINDLECIICELADDILQKSKVAEVPIPPKGDSWIDRLYAWADENGIPDLEWMKERRVWSGLPRDREKLTNLTELDLFCVPTSLPAEIGRLTNLTKLNLGYLHISSLPAEIGQLTNLTELRLPYNQLTSLPAEIGRLTNLTRLDLEKNQLSSLPAEIGQLTNLTELRLPYNQLTSLPAEIGRLTNLNKLYLKFNQLTSLPAEIWQLTNLTELDLMRNQLTSLPAEIGQLTNLTELDLGSNKLTSLPADIGQLTTLTELDLMRNQLTSLPAEIGQLTNLTTLYLEGNQLTSLPQEIFDLPNLKGHCQDTLKKYSVD